MTPILSRLTDLIPFERKKKPMRAHVPLYTNWGIGVDGWLWSSILRNRNLPDDRVGYAMAYLLVPEIRTCVDIYVDQIERIAWMIQENPGWDAKHDNPVARSTDKKDRHPFQRAMTRHRRDLSIGFLRRLAYMMLLFDEVYVLPEVNDYGLVSDLTVLNNLAIQPQVQSGYLQWIDYFSSGGGAVKYRPNELAIDHGFNPMDDFRGSSLVMTAIDSINVLRNLVAYLNEFFVNNARMGLVGSTSEPLSAEQLKQLRETIADFLKGKGNQFRTFISPVPVDWTVFENPDIEKQFNIDAPMVEKIFRAFRVPLALAGDLQGTRYKESADVDAIFIKRSVAPILKNVQEFVNDSLLPYFVEHSAGGQIDQRFEFDLSEFDSLTDGDKLQNDIVNQNVTAGLIPIAHAQELAGYEPDDALKEYYMLQGIPVPKLVYLNYYKKQFGVDESGNIPQEPQEPLSVGGKLLPRPALPGVNGNGGGEKLLLSNGKRAIPTDISGAYVVLAYFDNTHPIRQIQDIVRGMVSGNAEWNAPETFHVTLLYSGDTQFADIQQSLPINPAAFSVIVDGIGIFNTPNGYAIHLTVRGEGSITAVQSALAMTAQERGVAISPYSIPEQYHPHITLCYANAPIEPFEITPFTLLVNRIEVSGPDESVLISQSLRSQHTHSYETSSSFGEHRFVSDKQRRFFFAMFGDMANDPEWGGKGNRQMAKVNGYTDYGTFSPREGDPAAIEASTNLSRSHLAKAKSSTRKAIETYSSESYQEINSGIRKGSIATEHKKTVTELDNAIRSNTLPENTVLYRGMGLSKEQAKNLQPGATLGDKSFVSTSLSQDIASNFARGDERVVMRIKAPKGTNALAIQEESFAGFEREVLLPRDTKFVITKVTKKKGQYYVDAKILKAEDIDTIAA